MGDKEPPMWVPVRKEEPTAAEKEEAKKSSQLTAEMKMSTGYLLCKS